MKLSGYRKDYYSISGKASDVARQLAFAGIALIWIFKAGDDKNPKIPDALVFPLALFAFALACDLLHYFAGTIIWGSFHRYHERKLNDPKDDPEVIASPLLNWPINTFFILKLTTVIFAYFLLLKFFMAYVV